MRKQNFNAKLIFLGSTIHTDYKKGRTRSDYAPEHDDHPNHLRVGMWSVFVYVCACSNAGGMRRVGGRAGETLGGETDSWDEIIMGKGLDFLFF